METNKDDIRFFKSILKYSKNKPYHKRLLENLIAGNIIITQKGNITIIPSFDFHPTQSDIDAGRTEKDVRIDSERVRNKISADLRSSGFTYLHSIYHKTH
ncbi:MAG: hypothetical protein AABY15_06495 [Nanoarchaeota archaeon]